MSEQGMPVNQLHEQVKFDEQSEGVTTSFRLEVPAAALADLKERIARTRWPDEPPGDPWSTGTSLGRYRATPRNGAGSMYWPPWRRPKKNRSLVTAIRALPRPCKASSSRCSECAGGLSGSFLRCLSRRCFLPANPWSAMSCWQSARFPSPCKSLTPRFELICRWTRLDSSSPSMAPAKRPCSNRANAWSPR